MARTAAELVAALDSGEPSRVLRTPEGWYTTQVLDFCKELWEIDPLAQDTNVKAAIAALPHPSHWEDEASARATISRWLSVLSVAYTQFTGDPLAWRDKTRPPETHRDRPWINSFTFKPLPGQLPTPFTMGTETWHRSGGGGIRVVAGKDPDSYAIYSASGPLAWRTATTMDLRKYQEEGLQGYGIRTPYANASAHLLTLDRLYSHLLYCVMDCPPPGYEPTPTAVWKAIPLQNPATKTSPVTISWECVSPGVIQEWSGTAPRGAIWQGKLPDSPVTYKKYSVGARISWKILPPVGGWSQKEFSVSLTVDGVARSTTFALPTAQWAPVAQPVLTRAEGGTLKPTLRCTQRGYIWGGWSYSIPTGWHRKPPEAVPNTDILYEPGAEVNLAFQINTPASPDTLLAPVHASLSVEGTAATAQYQPATVTFVGTTTETSDPSTESLSTHLTSKTAGYLVSDMTRTLTTGWTWDSRRLLGNRGDWVEANRVFTAYATRNPGTSQATDATLTLSAGGVTSSASYKAPWATWEMHGEATATYTRFTFKALTAGKNPWLYKSFDPALPQGTTATFELEMPLGEDGWSEKGRLGSVRYTFSKPLTQTTTTTLRLGTKEGVMLGQETSVTFLSQPKLSIKSAFHWLPGDVHSVQGEIQVDSDGVIPSQGWTQSPSNGNVIVLYYNERGQGTAPTFPLTVKRGTRFSVTCTWLASQDGLAKSLAYRLGTQQWSWTS